MCRKFHRSLLILPKNLRQRDGARWTVQRSGIVRNALYTLGMVVGGTIGLLPVAGYGAPLALDDILDLAKRQTIDRSIIEHQYQAKKAESNVFRASALPTITSSLSSSRIAVPTATLGGASLGSGGPPGQGATNSDRDGSEAEGIPDRVFGNAYAVGINLSAPIYTFGRTGAVWSAWKTQQELLEEQRHSDVQNYYLDVITAYSSALTSKNLLRAAKRSERYAASLKQYTEIEYNGGARSKVDLLRATSFHALASAEASRAASQARATLARLQIKLGLTDQNDFTLQGGSDLPSNFLKEIESSKASPVLQLAELRAQFASDMVGFHEGNHWPSLALMGSVSNQIRDIDGKSMDGSAHEFSDTVDPHKLTYSIGLGLNWTLFDGFRTSSQVRQAEAEKAVAEATVSKLKAEESVEQREAYEATRVASTIHMASKEAAEAAALAMDQIDSDFKAGAASMTEMLEVQKDLLDAERQLSEAYANKILTAARLRRVHGLDLLAPVR